jgi:ribonuclease P protein component
VPALRSRRDFARIESAGRSRADLLIVVRYVANGREHDRVGISTGRRLGTAVVRNTVRRRIREIVRACDALVRPPGAPEAGRDILIVARPACVSATFSDLRSALDRLLRGLPAPEADRAHGPVRVP